MVVLTKELPHIKLKKKHLRLLLIFNKNIIYDLKSNIIDIERRARYALAFTLTYLPYIT